MRPHYPAVCTDIQHNTAGCCSAAVEVALVYDVQLSAVSVSIPFSTPCLPLTPQQYCYLHNTCIRHIFHTDIQQYERSRGCFCCGFLFVLHHHHTKHRSFLTWRRHGTGLGYPNHARQFWFPVSQAPATMQPAVASISRRQVREALTGSSSCSSFAEKGNGARGRGVCFVRAFDEGVRTS